MTIEQWLRGNSPHIEGVLANYATDHIYFGRLPTVRLPLSDHGLCNVVGKKLITFPSPFAHKKVTVYSESDPAGTPHFVGFDGKKILDIVSGQFFSDHNVLLSGIGIMVAKSPHLFINVSPELTVLYATATAVSERLSLKYVFNYPRD